MFIVHIIIINFILSMKAHIIITIILSMKAHIIITIMRSMKALTLVPDVSFFFFFFFFFHCLLFSQVFFFFFVIYLIIVIFIILCNYHIHVALLGLPPAPLQAFLVVPNLCLNIIILLILIVKCDETIANKN